MEDNNVNKDGIKFQKEESDQLRFLKGVLEIEESELLNDYADFKDRILFKKMFDLLNSYGDIIIKKMDKARTLSFLLLDKANEHNDSEIAVHAREELSMREIVIYKARKGYSLLEDEKKYIMNHLT